jgi:hypothetical protein
MPKGKIILDKRIHPRFSTRIPIRYRVLHNAKEIEAIDEHNKKTEVSQSADISLGGLRLVTKEVLKLGSFLRLHISVPSKFLFISTLARVVWTTKKGAGIHFVAMKEDDVKILNEYINKMSPAAK